MGGRRGEGGEGGEGGGGGNDVIGGGGAGEIGAGALTAISGPFRHVMEDSGNAGDDASDAIHSFHSFTDDEGDFFLFLSNFSFLVSIDSIPFLVVVGK